MKRGFNDTFIVKNTIIDPTTGEILTDKKYLSWSGWKDGAYKFRGKARPLKIYFDAGYTLTASEMFVFLNICKLMNKDNLFMIRDLTGSKYRNDKYIPMTKADIFEQVQGIMSISTFNRAWQKLSGRYIKKIKVEGMNVWAVNPALASKVDYVPLYLYLPFKEDIDPYLSDATIKRYRNLENSI